jgi:hypothetical protein
MNSILERHPRFSRTRSRRAATTVAALATLALGGAACGGSDAVAPSLADGTGRATVTGVVSAGGVGLAYFFHSVRSDPNAIEDFRISIAPAVPTAGITWQVQFVNYYTGRLAVGSYVLTPANPGSGNPTASFYYTPNSSGTLQIYPVTSGQLLVTSSSPSGIRGTFTFTAANFGGGGVVTVEGAFSAKCMPGTACQ